VENKEATLREFVSVQQVVRSKMLSSKVYLLDSHLKFPTNLSGAADAKM